MPLQLALFAASFTVGLALQLRGRAERLRDLTWIANFWVISPAIVLVAFLRLHVDAGLVRALLATMLASWAVIGLAYLYGRAVTPDADERGALTLAGGFGNTAFLGFPLAQLAFGQAGFTLAVLYDRLSLVLPMFAVSTVIARLLGRRTVDVAATSRWRAVLLNPPAWAFLVALALRWAGVHPNLRSASEVLAYTVSASGFLLLGLALPLGRIEHEATEVARAAGAVAIRFGASPLVLYGAGLALGAHIPKTFYLMSAMPVAFHLLVLARVYDLRPSLMRLLVVGSTIPGVIAIAVGAALFR